MEDEIRTHLADLLKMHKRRLRELKLQAAQYGLNVPPEIVIEIEDIENTIRVLDRLLGPAASRTLPYPPGDFVGREREIERLVAHCRHAVQPGKPVILCVRGMGGVGKTTLVRQAARRLAAFFPDGQLAVRLRDADRPATAAEAMEMIIRALSPATQLPNKPAEIEDTYHTCLIGKRVLIVADDAEKAEQVQALVFSLPDGCALVITSRNRFPMEGMTDSVDLAPLAPAEAATLLLTICPRIEDYASALARLCDYLPWALRASAGDLVADDTKNVARYVARLEAERLKYLPGPDAPSTGVEVLLRLSYEALDANQRSVLHQLGVFPASFDLPAAQVIVEGAGAAQDLLGALRKRCLLDWEARAERYDLHDLVRGFARAQQAAPDRLRLRHARYYAELAQRACSLLRQENGPRDGLALFDQEWAHIDAGWAWAHQQIGQAGADDLFLAYAESVLPVIDRYYGFARQLALLGCALKLARRAGRHALQAPLLVRLGDATMQIHDDAALIQPANRALRQYRIAVASARDRVRPRDWWSECRAWIGIGMAHARNGELVEAIWDYMLGLSIARDFGYSHEICLALSNLGNAYVERERVWDAIACYDEGLDTALEHDDQRIEVKLLRDLGAAYRVLACADMAPGRDKPPQDYLQQAEAYYQHSNRLARQIGDISGAIPTHWHLDCLARSREDRGAGASYH